ncbi:tRNA (cytidine(34)-2'-O)-methyltransferase [Campylobacter sp. RM9344]|uniref:Putative tRNA (cytidine(34)-2'-O)-methyltransferase n=1 Tax=Campylobacter californiensis TaxID=1032243 RepID=A0AAW3ZWX5_9BACT|nr:MULTISPECIES: tRNA (cytidine(34)-2'-O)-methyltransferase [unclassified Campylobacter]MBE2985065.1 tRNA (cytidine(34)-2'-O)-methyltransferase [Campylobacter sp. RM6883]MBE2986600.1 tRNA (cytidine(34)-2'-O)-methyltransferase [Campylobacter sp. RM12919]MBE2987605.1 tRNA (cytidine(34)-2'-O)-methyltransferase [Campylobacter sp. RM12920]MBE2995610.1 tRNA (cytidine(34)-2'-O)-methyltransferase [Campylobacter sp. RM6913]MBE3022265.1 tRNA (cytidine(34)-2'-O)-methyltransferase [Campylobacter sp. 7477a
MFNIVLVSPQIPQNTGAIGRMCVNANLKLHIVKPTVFSLDEKAVRRAGLDYWKVLDPVIWESLDEFLEQNLKFKDRFFFATTKTNKLYFDAKFKSGDFIFFGGESTGLPGELMKINEDNKITIPMGKQGRSLNQAMSVAIVAYEAIRQNIAEFDFRVPI